MALKRLSVEGSHSWAILVPTVSVGMQCGRSARRADPRPRIVHPRCLQGCLKKVCTALGNPHALLWSGGSLELSDAERRELHYHAERGNEKVKNGCAGVSSLVSGLQMCHNAT